MGGGLRRAPSIADPKSSVEPYAQEGQELVRVLPLAFLAMTVMATSALLTVTAICLGAR